MGNISKVLSFRFFRLNNILHFKLFVNYLIFRFRASYIDHQDTRITANLSIDPVVFEDVERHFYLEASNEHGRLEYVFALELTPQPTEMPYNPIQGCLRY